MAGPEAANGFTNRRDRPWLLPYNRKLRNLTSISLRNINLTTSSSSSLRQRGKTIDDDALPHTLVSPAKLVALREQKALGHSRSSSDLRRVPENAIASDETIEQAAEDDGWAAQANGGPKGRAATENGAVKAPSTPQRPVLAKLRRRSTLEWANASPAARQEKLEGVTAGRTADVFFSLHVADIQEPVYISETVECTMNPTFRSIDLSRCGPGIIRLDNCTLRFWAKSAKWQQAWRQFLELSIDLRSLHYLGKNLETLHYPLPQNAVIFHLTDGVYTAFSNMSEYTPPRFAPNASVQRTNASNTLSTSSFDALLRLAKLDDSIQDALATRDRLASDLESLLKANRTALAERDEVLEAEDRLKTIDYAKHTVEKQLAKARNQQAEKRASLASRRELMAADKQTRKNTLETLLQERSDLLPHLRPEREQRRKATTAQRRRICEELQKCYPIIPVEGKSLAFTIRGLPLPNADDIDSVPPHQLAAALGHVAHVLQLLSFYLSTPLLYPVNPRGSTSTILDPISILPSNSTSSKAAQSPKHEEILRTYPLFTRSAPRFKTDYALFLLNKDIQLLLESCFGVRVLDIRHTLANLKYMFYVATAGEGELPARKAGGVRGLMKDGTDGLRRVGSQESDVSAVAGAGFLLGTTGKGAAMESLKKLGGKK